MNGVIRRNAGSPKPSNGYGDVALVVLRSYESQINWTGSSYWRGGEASARPFYDKIWITLHASRAEVPIKLLSGAV